MFQPIIKSWLLAATLLSPGMVLAEPNWKVRIDPLLAVADFPNLEIDRAISPTVSLGAGIWHHDGDWFSYERTTSLGVRLDWFDRGVFTPGWHSNVITRADFNDNGIARLRLKGTQTYQWVWSDFLFNTGIGLQFVADTDNSATSSDNGFGSDGWVYPAWELSIGRAF
ncbi:hypothetical protein [Saccharospirillum impatiens]|uniref:hypothetical protein n=1 Tax=Saccharospirillum impatiens TaxID=169438 RepID=UPI00041B864F|nr:hypothetical protein [Saccharospirillum impatiens]